MGIIAFFHRLLTRRVACVNCPHYRVIRTMAHGVKMGACAIETETGFVVRFPRLARAVPVRFGDEWCEQHPLFEPDLGDGIIYMPQKYADNAGLSRAPTLGEAMRIYGRLDKGSNSAHNSADNKSDQ